MLRHSRFLISHAQFHHVSLGERYLTKPFISCIRRRPRKCFSTNTNPNIKNEVHPGLTHQGSRLAQLIGGEEAIQPWSTTRRVVVSTAIALTLTFTAYVAWGAETIHEYILSFFEYNPELMVRLHAQKCIARHPEVERGLGFPIGFDRTGYRTERIYCVDNPKEERIRLRFKMYGPRGEGIMYVQGDPTSGTCEFVAALLPGDSTPHAIFDSIGGGNGVLPALVDEKRSN